MLKIYLKPFQYVIGLCILNLTQNASATNFDITNIPSTPQIGMATSSFVPGMPFEHIYYYITPNGNNNGSVQNFNADIYYADSTPGDSDLTSTCGNGSPCEKLGNLSFQNVLWDGAGKPVSAQTLSGGAITLGGFNLTDTAEGGNYAYLQIYSDNAFPTGTIDGGNYYGKVNSDIPGYMGSPNGWNYLGTQYNFLDIPFDTVNQPEGKVSFETALVQYNGNNVNILADLTWSYTTGYSLSNCVGSASSATCFGVTGGSQLTLQNTASQNLLDLYNTAYGSSGYIYNNLVTTAPVPLPSSFWLFIPGLLSVFGFSIRKLT